MLKKGEKQTKVAETQTDEQVLSTPFKLLRAKSLLSRQGIERQVIEGRPQLIERFACKNRNVIVRGFPEVHCFFALRVRDGFLRLTAGVSANALLDSVDVFRCPDEFEVR